MRLVTVVATLAALALASSAAGQERHPASLRVVSARPCGAAIPSSGEVLTITPNGDGVRDCAAVAFVLARPARVEFVVAQRKPRAGLVYLRRLRARTGITTVVWAPPPTIDARTYVTRLSLRDASGALTWRAGPVIRVRATRARFERESYAPGELARLLIDDRASTLQLEIVDAATEQVVAGSRRVRGSLARIRIGRWPPGVYVARLRAGDALIQAPLVVRAPASARPRVGVVLPTNTWQAYNLLDGDGDGTGDSWYASRRRESARLDRPFMGDGLPPYFHRYDLSFLRWLRTGDRRADFLSDADLDRVPDAATLARRYDLLVFPGHHEYVTAHEYELLTEYRDRGGNLIFLSADNLHWRVVRIGPVLRRKEQFRNVAALVGVEYRASDRGGHRDSYVVRNVRCAPWLLAGTGLATGSRFGWGGVEIDAVTRDSPRGTCVVAEIPHLLGPGRTAQMTYYETSRGAKVFAAGAFSLPNRTRVTQTLLDNLWTRLSRP